MLPVSSGRGVAGGPAGRIEDHVHLKACVARLAICAAATSVAGLWPASAGAQATRAAVAARAQAEKARQLPAEKPGLLECALGRLDARGDEIAKPIGFYPWFGSIYSSGAVAAGAGLRAPLGDTGAFDVKAGWSVRRFKMVDAELRLPSLASGRLEILNQARWMDAPTSRSTGSATIRAAPTA